MHGYLKVSLLLPGMHWDYGVDHWMIWKLLDSLSLSQMHVLVVVVGLVYKWAWSSSTMFSSWMFIHAWLGFLFVGFKGFIDFPKKSMVMFIYDNPLFWVQLFCILFRLWVFQMRSGCGCAWVFFNTMFLQVLHVEIKSLWFFVDLLKSYFLDSCSFRVVPDEMVVVLHACILCAWWEEVFFFLCIEMLVRDQSLSISMVMLCWIPGLWCLMWT